MEREKDGEVLARKLARELTESEIEQVSGAIGTDKGTIAGDRHYDPQGDHWLPY